MGVFRRVRAWRVAGAGRLASRAIVVAACVCLVGLSLGSAPAQNLDCDRLQAAIQASGGMPDSVEPYGGAAARQRGEIARTQAYGDSIGCGSRQFNDVDDEPPQCAAIEARMQRMQANLARLETQVQMGGQDTGRRAALVARYNAACTSGGNPADLAQGRAGQFYPNEGRNPADLVTIPVNPDDVSAVPLNGDISGDPKPRSAGQALCVRTCDGGFFPMTSRASQDQLDGLDQLCKASCPNTEARLYTTGSGTDLNNATAVDGTPYTSLPAAFKFQKTFDASCTCKPPNQSWTQALAEAEKLLGNQHKGDVTVTAKMSSDLAKPGSPKPPAPTRARRGGAPPPPVLAETGLGTEPLRGSQLPTGSIDPAARSRGKALGPDGRRQPSLIIMP